MFGFSISKLIFTVLAIVVVWYGFKWIGRIQQQAGGQGRVGNKSAKGRRPDARPDAQVDEVEDLIKCSKCDSYVSARGSVACGREGCPFPGG